MEPRPQPHSPPPGPARSDPACANCGEPVARKFCPACGQPAHDRRGPLVGLLGDFFSEFFSLDGRHLRTAARLWIPGRLTQLYLEGRRASYAAPIRVYFVASLLFFVIVGIPIPDAADHNVYVDDVLIGRDAPEPGLMQLQLMKLDDKSALGRAISPELAKKRDRLQAMSAQDLLDDFFTGLERRLQGALICFVPIVALAMALLYIRRPFYYVDHLVFALHLQSFLLLTFVLAHLLNVAGLGDALHPVIAYLFAFFLVLPIYMLLAMRRVYAQSWLKTLAKGAVLWLIYLVSFQIVLLVTLYLVVRGM